MSKSRTSRTTRSACEARSTLGLAVALLAPRRSFAGSAARPDQVAHRRAPRTSPAPRRSRRRTARRWRPRATTSPSRTTSAPTEIVYQALEERRPRRLRRLPGHAAHVPRRHSRAATRRRTTRRSRPSSRAPASWPASRRPRSTSTASTSPRPRPRSTSSRRVSDLAKVSPASSRSAGRPSARTGRSASAPRRQQLYGLKFKDV